MTAKMTTMMDKVITRFNFAWLALRVLVMLSVALTLTSCSSKLGFGTKADFSSVTYVQWSNALALDLPARKSSSEFNYKSGSDSHASRADRVENSKHNRNMVYIQSSEPEYQPVVLGKAKQLEQPEQAQQLWWQERAITLHRLLKNMLTNKGYQVTNDPEQASIVLQAHVQQLAKNTQRLVLYALEQGYGGEVLPFNHQHPERAKLAEDPKSEHPKSVQATGASKPLGKLKEKFTAVGFFTREDVDASNERKLYYLVLDFQVLIKQYKPVVTWKRQQTRLVATSDNINLSEQDAASLLKNVAVREITALWSN